MMKFIKVITYDKEYSIDIQEEDEGLYLAIIYKWIEVKYQQHGHVAREGEVMTTIRDKDIIELILSAYERIRKYRDIWDQLPY